ncbi:MAG: alpha/beta fold hydrolase [Granulosicoccus sp.]
MPVLHLTSCLHGGILSWLSSRLLILASLFVLANAADSHAADPSANRGNDDKTVPHNVRFDDCSIGTTGIVLPAQCATLEVPLNPADPAAGVQSLAVAKIASRRRSGNTDALTLLAGGPGQSAIDTFPGIAFAFRHIMRDRDVILIDQRGTGDSTSLDCPEDTVAAVDSGLGLDTDPGKISQLAADCLASLDADPRLFTTSIAVKDLENVRQQLGISQWNLYGISYGTRVAMHYLRRYPDAVRSIVLDAVVPPQISLGPDIASLAQQSLERIFARCEQDTGCNDAFGNLTLPTLALIDELRARPRSITYEDVATGQLTTREFTHDHLAMTLRLMSYSSQTAAILPSMLYEAIQNNNLAPLARQSDTQGSSLSNSLSTGMHHAVICTEDVPFFDDQADTSTSNSYLGDDLIAGIKATCDAWPAGTIDDDFKDALVSDKPALILSGDADPITPPAYGELVARTLPNARHIVNEAQGHMQAAFGCMPVLLAKFVDTSNALDLETDCLKRLRPLPFFVDANGPLP